jgi:signal transduction histidine kinase
VEQLLARTHEEPVRRERLDLNAIVAEEEAMLRPLVGRRIRWVRALDPELGSVEADQRQLKQILMNLILNARDAMPHGGELRIGTANVELDEAYARERADAAPGPHVVLTVSDTGRGMDEATRSRIFEPSVTTKEGGAGLGLWTSYWYVRQHGGHISLDSEPGRGTTLRIYLPRAE